MKTVVKNKKHNKKYYENNYVEAIQIENKDVCPLCRLQPQKILDCITLDGQIVFYKQCQSCKGIVRIERNSTNI